MGMGKVAVHLLQPNDKGPIESIGYSGDSKNYGNTQRYSVVCDPLAGLPREEKSGVSYTGDHNAATCEKCKNSDYYRDLEEQRLCASKGENGLPQADPEDFPDGVLPSAVQKSESEENVPQVAVQESEQPVPAEAATDVESPEPESVPVDENSDPEKV